MDKEFVKKTHLGEAVKRFQEIANYKTPKQSKKNLYEYMFYEANEDDGELQQSNQPQNGAPDAQNQGGGMNGQMGGEMQPDASQMPQDGGGMPQDGGDMGGQDMGMPQDGGMGPDMGMPQGGDMGGQGMDAPMGDEAGGEMPQDGDMGPDMGMPQDEEDGVDTVEMEPDDEVIDVDELTQSQEATEYKIDGVDDRLSKIFAVVKKFSDQLEKQQQSIISLKDEFEKRNPTEEERLNIRSQSSYPYSELPKDYWEKKAKQNPHYNIMSDNEVSPNDEQEEFEIKSSDLNGMNLRNISDTLNIDQKLSDYLDF